MLDKFGRTLLLLVFVVIFIQGARMALKLANPAITKMSPSLGDTLRAIP